MLQPSRALSHLLIDLRERGALLLDARVLWIPENVSNRPGMADAGFIAPPPVATWLWISRLRSLRDVALPSRVSVETVSVDGEHPMELQQVRYFLALANTLNFTRAAEMCNVTQPALTKGVQKLEQELGGQLIYRERQLTHLTDLGKAVLPMLKRTLASAEAVRRRAREFQQKEVAPLAIGLAPSISASLVLEPIAEIRKFVPALDVELREESPSRLVELLLEGDINVALVGDLDDKPERIDDWALFAERYVAVLSPSHQLADLPVVGMEALRGATILDRSNCDVAPKFQHLLFPDAPPHHNHRSSRDLHLQHLAAAGLGIVLAPEHMPRLPSLKALPIEGDPIWREVRLLAVQGRRYSPALDAFVKVARLRDWSHHTGSPLQTDCQSRLEASGVAA